MNKSDDSGVDKVASASAHFAGEQGLNSRRPGGGMPERRASARVPLECVVRVGYGMHSIMTQTENISNCGFYCLVPRRFAIGDQFRCEIEIPVQRFAVSGRELRLTCEATVIHIREAGAKFGIGCAFHKFVLGAV